MYEVYKRHCTIQVGKMVEMDGKRVFAERSGGDQLMIRADVPGKYGNMTIMSYISASVLKWGNNKMWSYILRNLNDAAQQKVKARESISMN